MRNSDFYSKVYDIVSHIPVGRVATYGQIAFMVGNPRASRVVGYAMSRAPSYLPCHRVVNREGHLAPEGVFGSQEYQRALLEQEGVTFTTDGRINMKQHLWRFIVG